MSVYDRLRDLNIELGDVAVPAASYLPYIRSGKLLYLSGHLAKRGGLVWAGQLGDRVSIEEGTQAARAVAIDLISTLHHASGDLNKLEMIVKLTSMVNSTGDFDNQHLVTNGASDLLAEVFGDKGRHARSAFGVAQLPLGACVEIELIAQVA
ncbi:RidA family protein [Rhizobium sp. S163]|uniref:RidA family protein n=1 Tax=Rhizobium sp. S163 TaxID=3055039 RepID=UPI0025A95B24|nr:RidA family protein [Rhizobium sp. S163]MDM9648684.1 RidA family protein [Rhizobium sp. S163]